MSGPGVRFVERTLAKLLLPLCVVSGAVVLTGFFFPNFVGEVVTGRTWVTIALVFFASGLGYLAVLPYESGSGSDTSENPFLAIRNGQPIAMIRKSFLQQDRAVLIFPVVVFALFFVLQTIFPEGTSNTVNTVSDVLLRDGGPVFLGAMLIAVCFCLYLLVGPWGDIKLGGPETEPTYTYPTYFTLIFTAGIAAGVVFWGPAEALFHYQSPPPYFDASAESSAAIGSALTYSLFHWGFSAWSAYTVVGVPIAYYVFKRGAPLRVSAILVPFLGVSVADTVWGRLVDTLAVFAIVGGIATSVALLSTQFLAGIRFQWGVSIGALGPVLFVGGLTMIFVLSAVTGVHRGIRRLAGVNMVLFVLFALVLVAVGPRAFLWDRGVSALGSYAGNLVPLSVYAGPGWVADWTVWNWSWWFSWAPFAGLFIAALSRGRKIRTVVATSVVATSAATMVWFVLLGGTALFVQHSGQANILAAMAARPDPEAVAGFPLFAALPLSELLMFLFLALIVVFITTSADTSTLTVSILASQSNVAPSSSNIVFWGVFQGAVAVAVLLLGGAETLQALAVLTGGPFALLSLVAIAGLAVTLFREESENVSLVRRVLRRVPTIHQHHDIDPPNED